MSATSTGRLAGCYQMYSFLTLGAVWSAWTSNFFLLPDAFECRPDPSAACFPVVGRDRRHPRRRRAQRRFHPKLQRPGGRRAHSAVSSSAAIRGEVGAADLGRRRHGDIIARREEEDLPRDLVGREPIAEPVPDVVRGERSAGVEDDGGPDDLIAFGVVDRDHVGDVDLVEGEQLTFDLGG